MLSVLFLCFLHIHFAGGSEDESATKIEYTSDYIIHIQTDADEKELCKVDRKFLSLAFSIGNLNKSFTGYDIDSVKLKNLLSALSPSYIRIGGTKANFLYFEPRPTPPPFTPMPSLLPSTTVATSTAASKLPSASPEPTRVDLTPSQLPLTTPTKATMFPTPDMEDTTLAPATRLPLTIPVTAIPTITVPTSAPVTPDESEPIPTEFPNNEDSNEVSDADENNNEKTPSESSIDPDYEDGLTTTTTVTPPATESQSLPKESKEPELMKKPQKGKSKEKLTNQTIGKAPPFVVKDKKKTSAKQSEEFDLVIEEGNDPNNINRTGPYDLKHKSKVRDDKKLQNPNLLSNDGFNEPNTPQKEESNDDYNDTFGESIRIRPVKSGKQKNSKTRKGKEKFDENKKQSKTPYNSIGNEIPLDSDNDKDNKEKDLSKEGNIYEGDKNVQAGSLSPAKNSLKDINKIPSNKDKSTPNEDDNVENEETADPYNGVHNGTQSKSNKTKSNAEFDHERSHQYKNKGTRGKKNKYRRKKKMKNKMLLSLDGNNHFQSKSDKQKEIKHEALNLPLTGIEVSSTTPSDSSAKLPKRKEKERKGKKKLRLLDYDSNPSKLVSATMDKTFPAATETQTTPINLSMPSFTVDVDSQNPSKSSSSQIFLYPSTYNMRYTRQIDDFHETIKSINNTYMRKKKIIKNRKEDRSEEEILDDLTLTEKEKEKIFRKLQLNKLRSYRPFNMTADLLDDLYCLFKMDTHNDIIFDVNAFTRTDSGSWDPTNAIKLMDYVKKKKYKIIWQLGNEPNHYKKFGDDYKQTGSEVGLDYIQFAQVLSTHNYGKPFIVGPDTTRPLEDSKVTNWLIDFLNEANNSIDALSWHQYYENGRTVKVEDFLRPSVLNRFNEECIRMKSLSSITGFKKPIWITETGSAWGGGAPDISNRYVAGFPYLDKLGIAAKHCMKVVARQTFLTGKYAMVDANTYRPHPDYYLAVLFKRLVGRVVLDTTFTATNQKYENDQRFRVYAHCTRKSESNTPGSITAYVLNLHKKEKKFSIKGFELNKVEQYILTADSLQADTVKLNGKPLELNGDELPSMKGKSVDQPVTIPPYSFGFFVIDTAVATVCI